MADDNPKYEKVWIACRSKEGCTGNYAEMIHVRIQNPTPGMGQFEVAAGGKVIRYRCVTCGGVFTIST